MPPEMPPMEPPPMEMPPMEPPPEAPPKKPPPKKKPRRVRPIFVVPRRRPRRRRPRERKPPIGAKTTRKAADVLKSIRTFLRPVDVRGLSRFDEIRTKRLSGRGGDVVSGRSRGRTILVFNERAFKIHHPITWAALVVKELEIAQPLLEGVRIGRGAEGRGIRAAIAFLNQLPSRVSLNFLEKRIVEGTKELVRKKIRKSR